MTREQAKACAAFLQRVQLSGQEVETFVVVQRALLEIIHGTDSAPEEMISGDVDDNL